MHKLIEFLSNEMPDYADELISALNTAAESVGNIRDAITDMIPTLWNFLSKEWCHDNFGICYPLLKEVDITIPISKQKGYNNEYGRYWIKPILEIDDSHYILCSQWFEEFREKLDKWIEKQEIQIYSSKMDVYVLPKLKIKTCPKCGNKTEKESLYVTYSTAITDINNKLFTRRCNTCERIYIADTIFKSYTRSKNIENININFIRQDT